MHMFVEKVLGKYGSRKLLATLVCTAIVVGADAIGAPLDAATLEAVTNMCLGLVGAQGMVDTAAAYKTGKAVAKAGKVGKALLEDAGDGD